MTIAPKGRLDFMGKVGAKTNIQTGVLEPDTTLPGGLLMARAAVSPSDSNKVQVVLQNLSSRTVEIPRRQRIATLYHATVLESTTDAASLESFVPGVHPGVASVAETPDPRSRWSLR